MKPAWLNEKEERPDLKRLLEEARESYFTAQTWEQRDRARELVKHYSEKLNKKD